MEIALLGFGEAAKAFVEGWRDNGRRPDGLRAYDTLTDDALLGDGKRAEYAVSGVTGCTTMAEAVGGVTIVLSLVTADQAGAAARMAAAFMAPGTLYLDMNSVAPQTKNEAAGLVASAGGHYVDVAVMSPVRPALLETPLLVCGPFAAEAVTVLQALGFGVRAVGTEIGAASAIKMIRSVMVKGLEALTAECFLSAYAAGVQEEIFASLEQSYKHFDWPAMVNYNLERMLMHGLRRSAEMDEAARTVAAFGQTGAMSQATSAWQKRLGALGLVPPTGLKEKISTILCAYSKKPEMDCDLAEDIYLSADHQAETSI